MAGIVSLAIVGCGKEKLPVPAPAAELYTGSLFRQASRYAASRHALWFIASAKHHILAPTDVTAPYEMPLTGLRVADRQVWARAADLALRNREIPGGLQGPRSLGAAADAGVDVRVVVLAGAVYREFLVPRLEKWARVEVPLEGFDLFAQMRWYAAQRAQAA